jgi:site-specific DNA-methyltransferase (adenine-specific)
MSKIILGDCLEVMKTYKDNQFDLVITDPPYGIGAASKTFIRQGKQTGKSKAVSGLNYTASDWDSFTPTQEYFDEMIRVSKNQIIFGGNYFAEYLSNSSCWIVWDKDNGENLYADCELAWTSFTSAVRKFTHKWQGMLQHDMKNKDHRYHPTQKPLRLMRWCLSTYAKEGNTILDPFMGSGTTLRACKDLGFDCTGIEISPDYVKIAQDRLKQEVLL